MRTIIATCVAFVALVGTAHADSNQNSSINSNTEVFTGLSMSSENPDSVATTPGVYPPNMDAGTNDCANSVSGGGSVTGFGLAFGATYNNKDCSDRNWYALTTSRGQNDVAKAYACLNNDKMRRALIATGVDCGKYMDRLDAYQSQRSQKQVAGADVPAYCEDGGWASDAAIRDNCPNADQLLSD
jgi:hypothetical protein